MRPNWDAFYVKESVLSFLYSRGRLCSTFFTYCCAPTTADFSAAVRLVAVAGGVKNLWS